MKELILGEAIVLDQDKVCKVILNQIHLFFIKNLMAKQNDEA